MNKKDGNHFKILLLCICLAVLTGITVANIYIYKNEGKQEKATVVTEKKQLSNSAVNKATKEPAPSPKREQKVEETKNPEEAKPEDTTVHEVSLVAVGDNLIHSQVIASGRKKDGTYKFDHLYKNIKSEIKGADVAIINQETVLGGKSLGYSGYPRFNSPQEIGDAIVNAGFDVVLHATNHSMDKGKAGLQNSLKYWKKQKGITVLGANSTKEEYDSVKVIDKNGIKIAMLNYTYGLNGLPLPKDKPYMVDLLETKKVRSDIRKAKKEADFVVVFPHWGTEYTHQTTGYQKEWTELFAEEGVDLVIGAHPHVVEPVQWVKNKAGHKMLVYYSLGNFISSQDEPARMLGGLATVKIKKKGDGEAVISDASIIPIVTHYTPSGNQYTVYKLSEYTDKLAGNHRLRRKGLSLSKLKGLAKQVFGEWYQE